MAKAAAGTDNPATPTAVRIVVAGDRGTGKSSLIVTAATENFPANVPPLLPPTRLPEDFYPERVPITIIDTSSRYEFNTWHKEMLGLVAEKCRKGKENYSCSSVTLLLRLNCFTLFTESDRRIIVKLLKNWSELMQLCSRMLVISLRLLIDWVPSGFQNFVS